MREIINISLPTKLVKVVKREVKVRGFASVSEFFRHLLRRWQEDELLAGLRESQREIAAGKGKVLRSLKDLR